MPSFPLQQLPQELQDQIWETTLGIDGPATIQCLEVDFMDGLETPRYDRLPWFRGSHKPTIYAPLPLGHGWMTFSASHYLHVRDVAASSPQARQALERIQRRLRANMPADLIELHPEVRPEPFKKEPVDKPNVWLNTKRDILLLHSPSVYTQRALEAGFAIRLNWFCPDDWSWCQHVSFRPLPFFGLDRVERFAIDWHVEVKRGSIRNGCRMGACKTLRQAYSSELYYTPRERRTYCPSCLGKELNRLNDQIREGTLSLEEFTETMIWDFNLDDSSVGADRKLGLDEPGTFYCRDCQGTIPCAEGREHVVVANTPYHASRTRWQPVCHAWHGPRIETDIETLLMGRMPSLKTFYIIDTDVKLFSEQYLDIPLTLPCEVFEGTNCKFVEVNTQDPAWDVRGVERFDISSGQFPFNSFRLAERLRWVAYCRANYRHAQSLMDVERVNGGLEGEPGTMEQLTLEDEEMDMLMQDEVPDDRMPFNEHILFRSVEHEGLHQLQGPRMVHSRTLQSEWPEHLLPLKVKILARIDPAQYSRIAFAKTN
jgi:hypothetical protein